MTCWVSGFIEEASLPDLCRSSKTTPSFLARGIDKFGKHAVELGPLPGASRRNLFRRNGTARRGSDGCRSVGVRVDAEEAAYRALPSRGQIPGVGLEAPWVPVGPERHLAVRAGEVGDPAAEHAGRDPGQAGERRRGDQVLQGEDAGVREGFA